MLKKKDAGYTIIELGVAVGIIILLTIIGATLYTNTQKSARDIKRKTDLRNIAIALNFYYNSNNKTYPVSNGITNSSDTMPGSWIPNLSPNFIKPLINDPTNNSAHHYNYISWVDCSLNPPLNQFLLQTNLENVNDPESVSGNFVVSQGCGGGFTKYNLSYPAGSGTFVVTSRPLPTN